MLTRFAGYTFAQLAAIAGSTTSYVYSRELIDIRLAQLRENLPKQLSLHYSIKANPYMPLVSFIGRKIDGIDVSSLKELQIALSSGVAAEKISFSGPGKSNKELLAAITAGINIHVESKNELSRIVNIATELNRTPVVSIRINPDFHVRQSGMVMGGGAQAFGVDIEKVPEILALMRKNKIPCAGLHCYAGSQMLNTDNIIDIQRSTLRMMAELIRAERLSNVLLNIGGGLGIPYFSGESDVDLVEIGSSLQLELNKVTKEGLASSFAMELGRYIVGESGIYISRIIDKKESRGKTYLVLEGGMNHHLAATGNLGQVFHKNYPIFIDASDEVMETVDIVGPLCTPLDTLAKNIELPRKNVGDYIAIGQSGAYGFSSSPKDFLSHEPAVEIFL